MIDPFSAWHRMMTLGVAMAQTGLRAVETLSASHEVITKRSGIIGDAMRRPVDGDHRELARLIPEKTEAFSQAGNALVQGLWSMQSALLAEVQFIGGLMLRGHWPTPDELTALSSRNAAYALGAAEQAGRIGGATLAPVHARATANARRLRRTRTSF